MMIRLLTLLALLPLTLQAEDLGELIFEDSFERVESDDAKEEIGNGWGTNSAKRAKGDKQVDLDDGTMRIFISERADHAVSVTHPLGIQNGSVQLKFKLENPKDSIKLNFADLTYKGVHAGHLFAVTINADSVMIQDLKTGNMKKEIREAKLAKTLTKEVKDMLKTKQKSFPKKTAIGEWHTVRIDVNGEHLSVLLNGDKAGEFTSEGIAHPLKGTLRLGVAKEAVVDDVKMWKK
ncbi:MAG: family 16 glycoside hydrolase [Verrucomicrobiota bacterium]